MAITVNKLHFLRFVLQVNQNLVGLQNDMRKNAETWKTMATAQSPPIDELRQFMRDAGAKYEERLDWVSTAQQRPDWPSIVAVFNALGGQNSEVTTTISELRQVSTQLQSAALNTYAQVTNACNQILSIVDAPPSLWPE